MEPPLTKIKKKNYLKENQTFCYSKLQQINGYYRS